MKFHIIYHILIIVALGATGCADQFLDAPPSKNSGLKIENTESLDALLNHYSVLFDRSREKILGTDNYQLHTEYFDAQPSRFVSSLQYILWIPELLEQGSYYWQQEFNKISYANTILATVDDVEGTVEDKERLRADAHMLRAYEYFQLTHVFCLPYSEENRSELGLPLKRTLDYGESVKRKTLGETMDFIEEELTMALETNLPRSEDALWRLSLPGVQAIAARFYLYLHDYEKAEFYADKVLQSYSTLVDYEAHFTPFMRVYNSNGGTYTGPNASSDFKFEELLYSRLMYNHTGNAVPSDELLALYDQANDFRYEGFMVEDYSLNRAAVTGWSAYWQFGSIGILEGPTTAEMYLIRAECRARDNNIAGAVADLNQVRSHRYKNGTYVDLEAGDFPNVKSATQFVVDERRREFPMTLRWYDIKRINSDPANLLDKITITREFYQTDGVTTNTNEMETYTLAPGDPRFAWPLPEVDIQLSRGELVQNPY